MKLWQALAEVIHEGLDFTSDDVTANGSRAIDGDHAANGRQNGIGSMFQTASRRGLIVPTGQVVKSTAPHRKGGMIRVWRPTAAGLRWAEAELKKSKGAA